MHAYIKVYTYTLGVWKSTISPFSPTSCIIAHHSASVKNSQKMAGKGTWPYLLLQESGPVRLSFWKQINKPLAFCGAVIVGKLHVAK